MIVIMPLLKIIVLFDFLFLGVHCFFWKKIANCGGGGGGGEQLALAQMETSPLMKCKVEGFKTNWVHS